MEVDLKIMSYLSNIERVNIYVEFQIIEKKRDGFNRRKTTV